MLVMCKYSFRGFTFTHLKRCLKQLFIPFHNQKKRGKKVINFAKAYMARFRDKMPTQPV